jgi:hypothetical protein
MYKGKGPESWLRVKEMRDEKWLLQMLRREGTLLFSCVEVNKNVDQGDEDLCRDENNDWGKEAMSARYSVLSIDSGC